jgi:hypothetical protein
VLRLSDHWTWDFWFAQEEDTTHVFYLKAPKSLGDPDLRHVNARIGHAVSTDLRNWTELPDALEPGPEGSWDDMSTWTGSVIRAGGTWHLFYTGISHAEKGLEQRIGHAVSDDLITWTKDAANPVLEADGRFYEQLDTDVWPDLSWRDPWVYWNEETGDYRIASAGHPPALHFDAGKGHWRAAEAKGLVLGVMPDMTYAASGGRLRSGDALMLYTDGLIERPGEDLDAGVDRLLGTAEEVVPQGSRRGARHIVDTLGRDNDDDCALVVIRRE